MATPTARDLTAIHRDTPVVERRKVAPTSARRTDTKGRTRSTANRRASAARERTQVAQTAVDEFETSASEPSRHAILRSQSSRSRAARRSDRSSFRRRVDAAALRQKEQPRLNQPRSSQTRSGSVWPPGWAPRPAAGRTMRLQCACGLGGRLQVWRLQFGRVPGAVVLGGYAQVGCQHRGISEGRANAAGSEGTQRAAPSLAAALAASLFDRMRDLATGRGSGG